MVRDLTKAELLELLPEVYLADGFCDAAGQARPELRTEWATAASVQLLEGELSTQELAFTIEAFRLAIELRDDDAAAAATEALETVARMIRQPNNEGLVLWLQECAAHVSTEADLAAMESHLEAVLLLYAVVAEYSPSSPSSAPAQP